MLRLTRENELEKLNHKFRGFSLLNHRKVVWNVYVELEFHCVLVMVYEIKIWVINLEKKTKKTLKKCSRKEFKDFWTFPFGHGSINGLNRFDCQRSEFQVF